MLPEYLKYWGLSKPPFSLTPDPEMLYMSAQHREGLLRLKYAVVSNKGGAMLVSENAGDGKTTLLAKLRGELHEYYKGSCNIVFIDHPTLTANQMVGEIARQLGVRCNTTDKMALLNELRDNLLQSYRQDAKCVVMLDEGQMLCHRPDILQELRILLNFCVSDSFLLTFILSGQKPLDEAIRAMPEFHQRLPVRFFLKNLNREDTRELICFRLRQAGMPAGREIFSEDGYTGIFNHSRGCPRIICSVADLALVIAHSRYSRQVDFVAVSQACSDMNRTEGGYHYHYFLKSFDESGGENRAVRRPEKEPRCPICGDPLQDEASECLSCGGLKGAAASTEDPEKKTPMPPVSAEPVNRATDNREKTEPVPAEENIIPRQDAPILPSPARSKVQPDEERAQRIEPPALPDKSTDSTVIKMRFEMVESGEENSGGSRDDSAVEELWMETRDESGETGQNDKMDQTSAVEDESNAEPQTIKCPFCGLILAPEIKSCPNCGEIITPETSPDAPEAVTVAAESPADAAPAVIFCGSCGCSVTGEICRRCGNPVSGMSAEMELVRGLEQCGLARLIVSTRYLNHAMPPDPLGEEIVFLSPGRFWSPSVVAQHFNGNGGKGSNSRCGLSLRGTRMNVILRGENHRLNYASIRDVSAEPMLKNGAVVLFRLVLSTDSGRWLFTLPFRGECGRVLADVLARYIRIRCDSLQRITNNSPGNEPSAGCNESERK